MWLNLAWQENAWSPPDEDGGDASVKRLPGDTTSSASSALTGNLLSKPLNPIYFGCLKTKKDALLLLEIHLRGNLRSNRGPQNTTFRAGYVFIWAQDDSTLPYWKDRSLWDPSERDGEFWISSQSSMGDGLLRKTLSVLVSGRCYYIVSYEDPWKVADWTLEAPSEDLNFQNITLRDELASQLAAESQATKDCRYPRATLQVSHMP